MLFSDMQAWAGGHCPAVHDVNVYQTKFGANPFVYSFDLAGYGSMQFNENKVFCLAGFSDKIFTIMSMMEKDKNALINEIKKVEF
jgi:60 kDa SS-A/Ro ribonucleoprotein